MIGDNPNLIFPGMVLYIEANPQQAKIYLKTQSCTVTVASLNARERPTAKSSIPTSHPQGSVLTFIEVIEGEPVSGISHWGHSTDGSYFWMGGTNRQQG